MYLLYIVLNEVEYLDHILKKFVELGVKGATIFESQGMGSAIVNNNIKSVPLFAYLKSIIEEDHVYSKTIMSVISSKELLDITIKEVRDIIESQDGRHVAFVFTLPVEEAYII